MMKISVSEISARKAKCLAVVSAAVLLGGCAAKYDVHQLKETPEKVCIVENPAVQVTYALPVIQEVFRKHGIETVVCQASEECQAQGTEFRLNYAVYQSWDLKMFLRKAVLELYKGKRLVATANLDVSYMSLSKWSSNEQKLANLVNQLLGKAPER